MVLAFGMTHHSEFRTGQVDIGADMNHIHGASFCDSDLIL